MFKTQLHSSNPYFEKPYQLYQKYQRYLPLVSFLAGFGWDSATLSRIDQLTDNLTLLAYLLLLTVSVVLMNLLEQDQLHTKWLVRLGAYYPSIIQFFAGGLFSAYVIYYRRSASLSKSALFFAMLLALFVSNEFLKERLKNIYLQMSILFMASFSFFIFFLPVLTHRMSPYMFLAGGVLSLGMVFGVLFFLRRKSAIASLSQYHRANMLMAGLFIVLNVFYWQNWIPPVPLSLKSAGIYHSVKRIDNQYRLVYQPAPWYKFWKTADDRFFFAPQDTVFCFASVFAPTALKTKVYHHWQRYSPGKGEWQSIERISYPIYGGRDGGYRGYTYKRHVQPGEWRVDVETADRRVLGRIDFTIIPVDSAAYPVAVAWR